MPHFLIDNSPACCYKWIVRRIELIVFLPKENEMKLSPPKTVTYWVSVVIGVLGFLAQFGVLAFLPISGFWLVAIAFIILALSLLIKGL